MKTIALLLCLSFTFYSSAQSQSKYQVTYYCPPCGCPDDGKTFDQPGVCPSCNMAYRSRVSGLEDKPVRRAPAVRVAVLLFDGADIMDVTGPMSVFEHAHFQLMTVAKDTMVKNIGRHLELTPDHSFATLPPVEVIVLPGGGPAESNQDPAIVEWVKQRSMDTETLFSVCSGAFFLGRADILDGQEATTFASLIPDLKEEFPAAKVLNNVKYTGTDQVFTSSGLSSGIDASFAVVAKYRGVGVAQDIANHMEYPWKRKNEYARSQLADNYIRSINYLVRPFALRYTYSQGDHRAWEYHFVLWEGVDNEEMMSFLLGELRNMENWETLENSVTQIKGRLLHEVLGTGNIELSVEENEEQKNVLVIRAERISAQHRISE